MEIFSYIFVLIVFFAIPCAIISSAKNRGGLEGFIFGALFGIFALIYYIFASSKKDIEEKEKKKYCSKCHTEVLNEDKFCSKCGGKFQEEKKIKCSNCSMMNKVNSKFCSKCGENLIKEIKEFICNYCDKKFKTQNELDNHLIHCKKKKEAKVQIKKDLKIMLSFIGFFIITAFIIRSKVYFNFIPLVLAILVSLPFFNKIIKFIFKKDIDLDSTKKIVLILAIFLITILINVSVPKCPNSCSDNNFCTNDFCSEDTGYKCMNVDKPNCNGNGICETGEYGKSKDCPNCNDNLKCTVDTFDLISQKCVHTSMIGCVESKN